MPKIAIDVVVLLPTQIVDRTIELNRSLESNEVTLGKESYVPHISLCMGSVNTGDLEKAKKKLDDVSKEIQAFNINLDKTVVSNLKGGEHWSSIKISESKNLQRLHEHIMKSFNDLVSSDVEAEMFAEEEVDPYAVGWVQKYKRSSSYKNFSPHLSLGVGQIEQMDLNIDCEISEISLCHLGKYCTCAKILHKSSLAI